MATFGPQGRVIGSDSYFKMQPGENKIRILNEPIDGWLDWDDMRPVRTRYEDKRPALNAEKPVKYFLTMLVWNYKEEKMQIWEMTQASIRKAINALCEDTDWGSPLNYDIKIVRKGEGMKTEYAITPVTPKPLDPTVKAIYADTYCNLEALYEGKDPWTDDGAIVSRREPMESPTGKISQEKMDYITQKMAKASEPEKATIIGWLAKMGVAGVANVTEELYDAFKKKVDAVISDEFPF